jgi:anti-sigma factor RsiW
MACNETARTEAYFDGTLDRQAARAAETHLETCTDCAALLRALEAIREGTRKKAAYYPAAETLRARVGDALDSLEPKHRGIGAFFRPTRSFLAGAAGGAIATAMAAAVAFLLVMPSDVDEITGDVVDAHIRSLIGNHLVDVGSADQSALLAWLKTHAGLAAPVAKLDGEGYALLGARADYVYGGSAAVSVYRHGHHVVNVFAWAEHEDETLPETASENGYNIVFWKKDKVVYCAVSNIALADLQTFARALRSQSG